MNTAYLWADGTWCMQEEYEAEGYSSSMSDDFLVVNDKTTMGQITNCVGTAIAAAFLEEYLGG